MASSDGDECAEGSNWSVAHVRAKVEHVLAHRTDRLLLVLEHVKATVNFVGCLRTADVLGVQNVWVVEVVPGHGKRATQPPPAHPKPPGSAKQGELGKRGLRKQARRGAAMEAAAPAPASEERVAGRPGDSRAAPSMAPTQPHADGPAAASDGTERPQGCGGDGGRHDPGADMGDSDVNDDVVTPELMGLPDLSALDPDSARRVREEVRGRLRLSRAASRFLDVRRFWSTGACVAALREGGWTLWATDVSDASVNLLDSPTLDPLPHKLAIVMGSEGNGVSPELLDAADRRVHLPMYGFSSSFNVSVATGIALQAVFTRWPRARGPPGLLPARREELRRDWYSKLARNGAQLAELLGDHGAQVEACVDAAS